MFSFMWWRDKLREDPWVVFLLLWVIFPLTVFFFSRSRLPLYVLPVFVPIALMAGRLTTLPSKGKIHICLLAAWIVFLVAMKYVGALFPYSRDSRAMAQYIAGMVQPVSSEVAFVGTEPFWGLNLYLGCEVERVVSSSRAEMPTDETLREELEESEQRVLFVVEQSKGAKLVERCCSLGHPVQKLGQVGSWVFIARRNEFNRTANLLPANQSGR
jgi:4-amino-4-deoxy-L-arabinose transferase